MKKKIAPIMLICLLIMLFLSSTVLATTTSVILKKAEDNVCNINLGEDGKLTKKLISVDDSNKEVTLQIDVTNTKSTEETSIPSEIMIVIDNSLSMEENKVDSTTTRKQAVFTAAKSLVHSILTDQSSTKIGIVSFSTNVDVTKEGTLSDATLVIKPTNSETSITSAIDSIVANGPRTDIDAGLQIAKANFSSDNLNKFLILLTDGVPNTAVGGPTIQYSGQVKTKTVATLKSIEDAGIDIITVMTGVDSNTKPDAEGTLCADAAGKTYKDLAEEIFGTNENPAFGKFYYISDSTLTTTITKSVYSDVKIVKENSIKNITIIDYFPDEIIANYDFELVEKANIGTVSSEVNTETNSIMWIIETLNSGETATIKYKLKLKQNYDETILNQIMPTNKNVEVVYTGTDSKTNTVASDVSPKIILVGQDDTTAPTTIPQTGEKNRLIILTVIICLLLSVGIITFKYMAIRK